MSARFRAVREEKKWSQQQAADACGMRREMWAKYEAGAEPKAGALASMAAAGIDVLYILTGQRSQPVPPQALLPEGDRILLDNFHAAPPQVQTGIETTLGAFAPGAGAAAKRGKAA